MPLSEVITEEEWRLLADQPSRTSHTGKRNLAALHAMYFAGLSISEVCGLSPWDLNASVEGVCVPGGARADRALVSVPAEAWAVFERWADVRPRSQYFFSTLSGNRLREQYVQAVIRRYADRSGLTKPTRAVAAPVSPRLGQRSYATRLIDRGLPDHEVARRLTTAHLPQAVPRRLP